MPGRHARRPVYGGFRIQTDGYAVGNVAFTEAGLGTQNTDFDSSVANLNLGGMARKVLAPKPQPPAPPPGLRPLAPLRPAPPRPLVVPIVRRTCFYDLPAELRIEIYKIALSGVILHILPPNSSKEPSIHALLRVSKQVRNETLPIIHRFCPIRTNITDLNFDGLLAFLSRIPPDQFSNLAKNENLCISFHTTLRATSNYQSLNRWLHKRADRCQPQPEWDYSGPQPESKVCNALKRKCRRMVGREKQEEMRAMLEGIGVRVELDNGEEESG